MHYATIYNFVDVVDALLEKGADVNIEDESQETALHHAVYNGFIDAVNALLDRSADINVKDSNGRTPLHYATLNNCVKIVDALLAGGASVHEKDSLQKTPLHYAAANGYVEIVISLLDKGANVYEKDSLQKTPLYYAIINCQEDTVEDIKRFLKNKVVEDSIVVGGSVAVLGNIVAATLFVTETVEGTLTSLTTAIAVSVVTALAFGYAKCKISKLNAEIKEIKERQNVIEGRQSLTREWQNVDLQSVYIQNSLS